MPPEEYFQSLPRFPVVKLERFVHKAGLEGSLFACLTAGGATGTIKDALAWGMLAIARQSGRLEAGQMVVEAGAGHFAAALAVACSCTGLLIHLREQLLCALHQFFFSSLDLSHISISCCLRSRFCKHILQRLNICFYCRFIICIQLVAYIFEGFLCLEYHCVCFVSRIDSFFSLLILSLELSCFFDSLINICIRHIRSCCDRDMLLFSCTKILS